MINKSYIIRNSKVNRFYKKCFDNLHFMENLYDMALAGFGKRIKEARLAKGWTIEELANRAGLTGASVSRIEREKQFSRKSLKKIADALGLPIEALLEDKKTWRKIPVINKAQCGNWRNFTDLDYPPGVADRYEDAPTTDPNAFYVIASGDSMVGGRIEEGDLLLVEPNKPVENGHIVLAKLNDEITVKKFYKRENHIILQPMNPKYEPIIITDPKELENLVVYRITRFTGEL